MPHIPPDRLAAERRFQQALARARARGGPAPDLDALTRRPPPPPRIFGAPLSRMTLGIERLLQKRACMPGDLETDELILFFIDGPRCAEMLAHYDDEAQAWSSDEARHAWEQAVREISAVGDLLDTETARPLIAWLDRELGEWHRLSRGDDKAKRSTAGSEGSRVGWFLRTAEEIVATRAHLCPPGTDLLAWAVWQFPVCDYLILLPAALERTGCEMPDHYALVEARKARTAAKKEAAAAAETAARETSAEPPRVEIVDVPAAAADAP
jgi:hypothetical protein